VKDLIRNRFEKFITSYSTWDNCLCRLISTRCWIYCDFAIFAVFLGYRCFDGKINSYTYLLQWHCVTIEVIVKCLKLGCSECTVCLLHSFVVSARCNICISGLCHDANPSVRLSVMEVHWRIIANLGFKFRSHFTAHFGGRAARRATCGRIISRHANQC